MQLTYSRRYFKQQKFICERMATELPISPDVKGAFSVVEQQLGLLRADLNTQFWSC